MERTQQARTFCWGIEDVHAGVAVVNGDLEGGWSEVDEPRGLPEVVVDHGGYFPGCAPVYGPGQCGVEVGEVRRNAWAWTEEGVSAVEGQLMLAATAVAPAVLVALKRESQSPCRQGLCSHIGLFNVRPCIRCGWLLPGLGPGQRGSQATPRPGLRLRL